MNPDIGIPAGELSGRLNSGAAADSIGALCAFLNMTKQSTTSSIESKTNFSRPVSSGTIRVVATPGAHRRKVVVVQTDATNEKGKLVSGTTQTQSVVSS